MADKRKQTAEEVAHLTLEHVKYIRGAADRIETDMHDLKSRVTNLEEGLAGVNRHLDRADMRPSRISYHPLGAPYPGLGPGEGGRCRLSAIPSSIIQSPPAEQLLIFHNSPPSHLL